MARNPFSDYYATLDNASLVAILRTPEDYQPLAVEAAKLELERRNYTDEDLWAVEQYIEQKVKEREQATFAYRASLLTAGVRSLCRDIWVQSHTAPNVRTLAIFTTFLAVLTLWNHRYLVELPMIEGIRFGLWDIAAYLEALWVPAAAVLLWLRYRIGWIMLVTALSFTVIGLCGYAYERLHPSSTNDFLTLLMDKDFSHYFISILFHGSLLIYACLPSIRRELNVEHSTLLPALLIPAILSLLLTLSLRIF